MWGLIGDGDDVDHRPRRLADLLDRRRRRDFDRAWRRRRSLFGLVTGGGLVGGGVDEAAEDEPDRPFLTGDVTGAYRHAQTHKPQWPLHDWAPSTHYHYI